MLRNTVPSTQYRVAYDHSVAPATASSKAMMSQSNDFEDASISSTSSYMDEDDSDFDDDFSASSASSDDSEWDESLMKIEEQVNSYAVMGATPAFAGMVFDQTTSTSTTANANSSCFITSPIKRALSTQSLGHGLDLIANANKERVTSKGIISVPRSISADLLVMQSPNYSASLPSSGSSSTQNATFDTMQPNIQNAAFATKPDDCLHSILREHYRKSKGSPITLYNSSDLKRETQFFLEMKPENTTAYDMTIASAARSGDLNILQQYHQEGKNLQACNRFHESIIHTICRRGHAHMLRYLLQHTDISIRICCDYGRTVLHDACWTTRPNFELITWLLVECPDLLLIKDSRGFTPLSYVGHQCWKEWCEFLEQNKELVIPRTLTV